MCGASQGNRPFTTPYPASQAPFDRAVSGRYHDYNRFLSPDMTQRPLSRTLSLAARLAGLGGLLLVTGGCFLGMYFPTSIETELAVKAPLRGSATNVQAIVVVLPSSLEQTFGFPDASRGKLDRVGLDVGEHVQKSGRFTVVSQAQYQPALAAQRQGPNVRSGGIVPDAERKAAILTAARLVNADAVLLLEGAWESAANLGNVAFGRPEYTRQLVLTLVATASGQTIWYQEATAVIHEGIAIPQEPAVRETVVADVAENFLRTVR